MTTIIASAPLSLGQVVITPAAQNSLMDMDIVEAIQRHARHDWGDLCAADRAENELSVREGFRVLSVYKARNGTKFWVITEADRSVTTILLPEDY